jgi:hypothetical protein
MWWESCHDNSVILDLSIGKSCDNSWGIWRQMEITSRSGCGNQKSFISCQMHFLSNVDSNYASMNKDDRKSVGVTIHTLGGTLIKWISKMHHIGIWNNWGCFWTNVAGQNCSFFWVARNFVGGQFQAMIFLFRNQTVSQRKIMGIRWHYICDIREAGNIEAHLLHPTLYSTSYTAYYIIYPTSYIFYVSTRLDSTSSSQQSIHHPWCPRDFGFLGLPAVYNSTHSCFAYQLCALSHRILHSVLHFMLNVPARRFSIPSPGLFFYSLSLTTHFHR